MAKEVGIKLKITSEGQDVVIKNLGGLETELTKLQQLLKTQDFGSEAFKKTAENISKLEGEIDKIGNAIDGLSDERRFQSISAAIGVATSSFQALSGVVGLFTSDTDDLIKIQEAETQALNVLNAALGVNNLLLNTQDLLKLKDTITTKAQTLATKAAAAAQRLWNLAISANPIGLFITAVAALTAAIFLFTKETKKSVEGIDELKIKTDEFNKINEEAISIRDRELSKITPIIALTEKENISKSNRNKLIRAIQKEYPNYLKNQDLEKITIQDIKKANDELIESMDKVARSRAALNELTLIYQEELKIQQKLEKDAQTREELLQKAILTGNQQIIKGQKEYNSILEINSNREVERNRKQLDIRKKVALSFIDETSAVKELTSNLDKNTKSQKQNNDSVLQGIQNRIKALTLLIKKIDESQKADLKYSSDLLNKQKEVLDKQEAFIQERTDKFKTQGEKLADEISKYIFSTIPSAEEVKKLTDGYKNLFDIITDAVKSGDIDFKTATGWEDFVKFADEKLPGIGQSLVNVSEDSRQAFIEYFNSLDQRVSAIKTKTEKGIFGFFEGQADIETLKTLLKVETDIAKLRADKTSLGLTENDLLEKSTKIIKEQFGFNEKIRKINQDIIDETFNLITAQQKGNEDAEAKSKARIDELNKEIEKYDEISVSILNGVIRTDDFVKGLTLVGKESDKNLEKILKLKNVIEGAFDPNQLDGLKDFFKQNANEYLNIFTQILNDEQGFFDKLGKKGIEALFSGIDEGLKNVEGKTRKELEEIQKFLKLFGDEFAKDFGLGENPFLNALNEISKKLKTLPTESEEAFTKSIENLGEIAQRILQVFSDISGRFQQLLQTQTSLLLENLQYQQEQTLAIIGEANSENAVENEKIRKEQLAAEKRYAKARFEIEKKARIQELQFQIANGIAAGANAVIQALALPAPPPLPQIYAGVIGGLTTAQVLLIREQLQFAQSKVFIGRRGGLINGASHDDMSGGVPAMLEGGEFVVNREAVRQYGDIIGSINNSTGGRPLAIDDSRLVQAISSQNSTKTPIKTYVLYNDIQDTDKLNKKIENLSRL